jgi:hypothetical protein
MGAHEMDEPRRRLPLVPLLLLLGGCVEPCLEVSFCERWETGRGRTPDEARRDGSRPR